MPPACRTCTSWSTTSSRLGRCCRAAGVDVSPVQDMGGVKYAHLSDPDGNTWALQQLAR